MSTASYLANYGISLQQAHDFVTANLGRLDIIFNVARQYGVTTEMLGEIAAYPGPAYSAAEVRGYFYSHGMPSDGIDAPPLVPSDIPPGATSLFTRDTATGSLSVDALRLQAIAQTGAAAYQHAFDPNQYAGGLDGVFSVAETGLTALGDLPADSATLESVFYGTAVRFGHSLDVAEAAQILEFLRVNGPALAREDPVAEAQLQKLLVSAMGTPTEAPYLSDAQVAQAAVGSAVKLVGASAAGSHDPLFDEVMSGFEMFFA